MIFRVDVNLYIEIYVFSGRLVSCSFGARRAGKDLMFLCMIQFSELRLKVHLAEEALLCQIVLFIPPMVDE
jgi:hypothetical protein